METTTQQDAPRADEVADRRRRRRSGIRAGMSREEILAKLGLDRPAEDAIQMAFDEYDKANPVIWQAFREQAYLALGRGIRHTSAKLIIDHLRWKTILDGGDGWKLNDRYTSRYVRKLIIEDTRFAFLFELRELGASRAA